MFDPQRLPMFVARSKMSPTTSRKTDGAGPLAFMTKVSPWVSVHRPQGSTPSPRANAPSLVLLLTWVNANASHIAKYVRVYQELYPSAQILLIRSALKHILWQPST
jgi:hypothetical protein